MTTRTLLLVNLTLSTWHRKLITQKYDGTAARRVGRPRTGGEIEELVVRLAKEILGDPFEQHLAAGK